MTSLGSFYNPSLIQNIIDSNNPEKEVDKFFGMLKKWSSTDGINFSAVPDVYETLPPAAYDIVLTQTGALRFSKSEIRTDELIRLPDSNSELVIKEIESFWEKKELFKQLGLPYKRGIILDGPPGSGKTCTVRWIINDVIQKGGIVFNFNTNAITFMAGMKVFRAAQPDTPIVVVMEDLDALLQMQGNSEVLNMLDGFGSIDNAVFLATTNYPERLQERVVNRPSRFDRRVTIDNPNAACRRIFLDSKFMKLDKDKLVEKKIDEEVLNWWVEQTEGLSFAHLQELFTAVIVFDNSFEESLTRLQEMKEIPDSENYGKQKGGFFGGGTALGYPGLGQPATIRPAPFMEIDYESY